MGLTRVAGTLWLVILAATLALGLHAIFWSRADVAPKCTETIQFSDANGDGALTFRDLWPFVLSVYNHPYNRLGGYSAVKSALSFSELRDRSCNGPVSQFFNISFWTLLAIATIIVYRAFMWLIYRGLRYRRVVAIDGHRRESITSVELNFGGIRYLVYVIVLLGILNALSINSKAVRRHFDEANKSTPTTAKKPTSTVEGQKSQGMEDTSSTKPRTSEIEEKIGSPSSATHDEAVKKEQSRSGF